MACYWILKGQKFAQYERWAYCFRKGKEVIVSMDEVEGTPEKFSVTYENLINDVNIGSYILLDDGLVELQVKEINKDKGEVKCDILNTGELKIKRC